MFHKMKQNAQKNNGEIVQLGQLDYIQNREKGRALLTIDVVNLTIMML